MSYLKGTSYDDSLVRNAVIDFFKTKFNILLNETPPDRRLIDLTGATETKLGVEVEGGKWSGCFWKNDNYSLISGLEFRTINIPIRKEKYWLKEYYYYGKPKQNESYDTNIFTRSNKDFTQMIVIRPETVRDPEKVLKTTFQPYNSEKLEDWLSFRREHVETYNLINGVWELDLSYEI